MKKITIFSIFSIFLVVLFSSMVIGFLDVGDSCPGFSNICEIDHQCEEFISDKACPFENFVCIGNHLPSCDFYEAICDTSIFIEGNCGYKRTEINSCVEEADCGNSFSACQGEHFSLFNDGKISNMVPGECGFKKSNGESCFVGWEGLNEKNIDCDGGYCIGVHYESGIVKEGTCLSEKLEENEVCYADWECLNWLTCEGAVFNGDTTLPGKCTVKKKDEGSSCTKNEECISDICLGFDNPNSGGVCLNERNDVGTNCYNNNDCKSGFCDNDYCAPVPATPAPATPTPATPAPISKGTPTTTIISSTSVSQTSCPTRPSQNCQNDERCKLIDEAWLRVGSLIGGSLSNKIFDTGTNNAESFDNTYCVEKVKPDTSSETQFTPSSSSIDFGDCPVTQLKSPNSEAVGNANDGNLENGVLLTSTSTLKAYGGSDDRGKHSYGTQELVNLLEYSSCYMKKKYGPQLKVHDLSLPTGGKFFLKKSLTGSSCSTYDECKQRKNGGCDRGRCGGPHDSHRSGLDADIGYYVFENGMYGNSFKSMCDLDTTNTRKCNNFKSKFNNKQALDANWEYIKLIQKVYDLKKIFVNEAIYNLLKNHVDENYPGEWNKFKGALQGITHHHDHYHLRIKCPKNDNRCDTSHDGRSTKDGVIPSAPMVSTTVVPGGTGSTNIFTVEIPRGAGTCTIASKIKTFPGDSIRVKDAATFWETALSNHSLQGSSWVGKLDSNGANDNFKRSEKGRITIVFVPCTTDFSKSIEVAYFFHGLTGFGSWDMEKRVAKQAKKMSDSGRNFVIVFPELPWSTSDLSKKNFLRRHTQSKIWEPGDSNLVQLHNDVLNKILELGQVSNLNVGLVSMVGHSAGGSALKRAAEFPSKSNNALKQIGVNKITFSDADYGWQGSGPSTKFVYNNYVKDYPSVELNMLIQDPSVGGAHAPTGLSINSVRNIGGSATSTWRHNLCTVNKEQKNKKKEKVYYDSGGIFLKNKYDEAYKKRKKQCGSDESIGDLIYETPGAQKNKIYPVPGHPNVHYVPLGKGHSGIGLMSLAWESKVSDKVS